MGKLAALKKNRGDNLKKLQEKLESQNQGYAVDERIWKPKFNKDKGKGTCVVRFLTPKNGDPFVNVMSYQFNGPGGNFWDKALQTIGEKDPVQLAAISMFRKAKAEGDEQLKKEAKKFLPRSDYYANVYVIKDEEHPENEGKVFIGQFGRQIFGFIEKAIKPEFDDVEPFDPFDYWNGADFKIRMIGKEIPDSKTGKNVLVPNYESSVFDTPSEFLGGDEDAIEVVYDQTYDLSEFVDPSKFKSFDEQAERFKKVTGKPYNYLSADGVDEHVADMQQQEKLDSEQETPQESKSDDIPEKTESHPQQLDSAKPVSDDMPPNETPLEKFKRLAAKSKAA